MAEFTFADAMALRGDPDMPDKLPLTLIGEDGNAFAILGKAIKTLRRAGRADQIKAYEAEAMAGDYDHLLAVTMRWFDVS